MKALLRKIGDRLSGADVMGFTDEIKSWHRPGGQSLPEVAERYGLKQRRAETLAAEILADNVRESTDVDDFLIREKRSLELANEAGIPISLLTDTRALIARRLFEAEYRRLIELGSVTKSELLRQAERLALNEQAVSATLHGVASEIIEREVLTVLGDGRVTPEEDNHLASLAARLGVDIDFGNATELLNSARARFQAESGPMPIQASPIHLQRGELCHIWLTVEAVESRERTVRVNYGGPAVRFRIMKGVYYNAGSYRISQQKEKYAHSFGMGTLVLTNKRIVFVSGDKTINTRFTSIVTIETYSDALVVRRTSGKPTTYYYDENPTMGILARRAIELDGTPLI